MTDTNFQVIVGETPASYFRNLEGVKLGSPSHLGEMLSPFEAKKILGTDVDSIGAKWVQYLWHFLSVESFAQGQTVYIENVEFGLHPKLLKKFVNWLRAQSNDDRKIVVTTNSVFVLDHCLPCEVMVYSKGDIKPIISHPEYEKWFKAGMFLGSFWSYVGEDF